jgi:uncharacterized membrane protein
MRTLFSKIDRSAVKAVTWRIVASLETCFLAWLVTGSVWAGLGIIGIEFWTKMLLYWLHDKAWEAAPGVLERLAAQRAAQATS